MYVCLCVISGFSGPSLGGHSTCPSLSPGVGAIPLGPLPLLFLLRFWLLFNPLSIASSVRVYAVTVVADLPLLLRRHAACAGNNFHALSRVRYLLFSPPLAS